MVSEKFGDDFNYGTYTDNWTVTGVNGTITSLEVNSMLKFQNLHLVVRLLIKLSTTT
jgi:hypothetical protein